MFWILVCLIAWLGPQTAAPTAKIIGRVIDAEDGGSVAGLRVDLFRDAYDDEGIPRLELVGGAVTGAQGEYEIPDVRPYRKHYLTTTTIGARGVYNRAFYPAASAPSSAVAISLSPGEEMRNVNFVLHRSRLATIRGRVRDALNVRQPHMSSIILVRRNAGFGGGTLRTVSVNRDDTFEIRDVPPDSYYLIGRRIDDEANRSDSVVPIEVGDRDITDVEVVAAEGHEIQGRVRGYPNEAGQLRLALRPMTGRPDVPGAATAARPNDGRFFMAGLPTGEYRLSIRELPRGYYVESARFGQTDLLQRTVFLRGIVSGSLEIVLSDKGGRVAGTVLDSQGKPAPSSMVTLIPAIPGLVRPDLHKVVATDLSGRFTIDAIAPGDYEIHAWEQFESNSYYDRSFMSRFKDRALPIHVVESSSATVQLNRIESQLSTVVRILP